MTKKIFFVFLICFTFFTALDIALRVYLSVKNRNTQYLKFHVSIGHKEPQQFCLESKFILYNGYYKCTPGEYGLEHGKYYSYSVNPLGFRGKDFSRRKPESVIRVCAFGGSTTFGHGVEDHQTYPYYLEEILNNRSKERKFEVINCGFPSYRMKNIYNLFKEEVINYQPDILIISEANNDAFMPEIITSKNLLFKLHHFFYYRWMLYTLLLEKYSLLIQDSPRPFFCKNKPIHMDYSNYLMKIIKVAEAKSIKVVLVKQSMYLPEYNITPTHTLQQLEYMYKGAKDSYGRRIIAQHYYLQQMEQIGRENNLLVIDPTPTIEKKPELFLVSDPIHLTPEGNRILARLIAEGILRNKGRIIK